MIDNVLALDDFAPLVGSDFTVVTDAQDMPPLTLVEAKPLTQHGADSGQRAPFSLVFEMAGPQRLDQGLYRLRNAQLGEQDIFIVPMSRDAHGMRFAVTFN